MSTTIRSTALLAVALMLAAAAEAQTAIRGNSGIRGTIKDPDGRPIAGATITRSLSPDTVRSDSTGAYHVQHLALGRHVFIVRRAGFEPMEFEVSFPFDTTLSADIPMERAAGAAAAGANMEGNLAGFERRRTEYERRDRRAVFMTRQDVAAKNVQRVSQLFDGIQDLTVRLEQGNLYVVYGQDARCTMNVWVNGMKMENVFPQAQGNVGNMSARRGTTTVRYTGLEDLIAVGSIEAVEVYQRPSMVPAQYQRSPEMARTGRQFETRTVDCGVILFWTQ